mmetsp:Transcript_19066/g.62170  ORF Transcript_19066/g.62170 Transcript_19066/m.62170 type:complete len:451 (-) Transcript_19066:45-1397(-)
MIEAGGGRPVRGGSAAHTHKSVALSWNEVEKLDPDVVVVACCGFDLSRNLADARAALSRGLGKLRAVREGHCFAADGNRYFARPSPSLARGSAILARCACAFRGDAAVAAFEAALKGTEEEEEETGSLLPPEGIAWGRFTAASDAAPPEDPAPAVDIEDIFQTHEDACEHGKLSYTDPETGYMVMTRLAHERRGRCCGSGCRHCPFAHANVKDKASKIQQPAFLHLPQRPLSSNGVTVLFWSGGKDSFLTLRALLRAAKAGSDGDASADARDTIVLLTTFDARTRLIAHQEVAASQVQRQAEHLDVALVGVPLHPGTPYLERVRAGLDVVRTRAPAILAIAAGDLHLRHIRDWRDTEMSKLRIPLSYPLWSDAAGSNYEELAKDLKASSVPCVVSAVADDRAAELAAVGTLYDEALAEALDKAGLDRFGERGELHTLAQVWHVPPHQALY